MREKIIPIQRKIASLRYKNPARGLKLIFVAGRYGKTTTATLLEGILKGSGRQVCVVTSGHDESIDHFYRMLWRKRRKGHKVIIVEVTDKLATIRAIEGIIPECLIFTSDVPYRDALLSLMPKHLVTTTDVVVPEGSVEPYQHISVGDDDSAEAKRELVTLYKKGTELQMTVDHQTKIAITTPLVGKANAYDLATAVATAYVFGIDADVMQEGVVDIEPQIGNFEWVTTGKPFKVIVDGAHDEVSVTLAIESAKQFAKRRLIVVFDMTPDAPVLDNAKEQADRVFVILPSGAIEPHGVDTGTDEVDVFTKATRAAKQDDIVLFLGQSFAGTDGGATRIKNLVENNE